MADINVQSISQAGITPSFVAASGAGDAFRNDGKSFLHIKNGGGSSITVTIDSVEKCNQGFDHDLTATITAGQDRILGPFEAKRFNDTDGKLKVSYSAVTTVTVAAFRL
ncbi:hypothetical protein J7E79_02700 [Bacillus sp. ISL-40]|uniref:hypothetical protein n=1 Tax=unclassified Bacillus (in: firmicutes) TaxID=185979 RepID=UPI001BE8CCE6|nr:MULTISPECIES: hypothetical protein [unclassified Bacillus (in: firmicutes)]MBT2696345.1 hypothetical protein [Bacillus sp. ISL-40]MBT2743194.1 hypothetical protein [Bacillus sp. ISL-77]